MRPHDTNPKTVQRALLGVYRLVAPIGLLRHKGFRSVYRFAYFMYKAWYEDSHRALIEYAPDLFNRGHILDVGANIGYTAVLFANRLKGTEWKVHAFEPEAFNLKFLGETLSLYGIADRVAVHPVTVADKTGSALMVISTENPSDHSLGGPVLKAGDRTQQVTTVSLDSFLAENSIPSGSVGFIKIDVQGAEHLVIEGMKRIIAESPSLSLSLELTPAALRARGIDPLAFLSGLREMGLSHCYRLHRYSAPQILTERDIAEIEASAPYVDILLCKVPLSRDSKRK